MEGGKEEDGFGRQEVDTRSVGLGQTGSETVPLHLASCSPTEQFLCRNNGRVIAVESLTRPVDGVLAGWLAGWVAGWVGGMAKRDDAGERPVETTELRLITVGVEPACKYARGMESFFKSCLSVPFIHSHSHTHEDTMTPLCLVGRPLRDLPPRCAPSSAGGHAVKFPPVQRNFHQSHATFDGLIKNRMDTRGHLTFYMWVSDYK